MIRGADFSAYQDERHLQAAINQGLGFAFVKTTEGVGYTSSRARLQIGRLEANRVMVGLYHFLTHDADGAAQWDHFETTLGWATLAHGLVAVDHERDASGVVPADHVVAAFIRRGHQRGYKVGRYASGSVFVAKPSLGEDWRWVAWWGKVPPPFKWDVWQFAAGAGGGPDWNVFHGDRAQLAQWLTHVARRKAAAGPVKRWWLHDDLTKTARGPFRLPRLGASVLAYLAAHPRTARLRLERK